MQRSGRTCPGIRKFVRPVPEYLKCLNCGESVEIWSDEEVVTCEACGREVRRHEKEQSCLDWCEHADMCREIIKNTKR